MATGRWGGRASPHVGAKDMGPPKLAQDPLTAKGSQIMENMKKEYGPKKGESVFYASRNSGKISGVDPKG
jgi:hypothetical protein